MPRDALVLVGVWVGLMVLLTLTVAATFGPFGGWTPAINIVIAFAKAGLIFWFFMHLREQRWLGRLVAVAAVAWLCILLGLTQVDILSRGRLGDASKTGGSRDASPTLPAKTAT